MNEEEANRIIVNSIEYVDDGTSETAFEDAYAIDESGKSIEPDDWEDNRKPIPLDSGVDMSFSIWTDLPETALMVSITCKQDKSARYDFIQMPEDPTNLQIQTLDVILDYFDLELPGGMTYEPEEVDGPIWLGPDQEEAITTGAVEIVFLEEEE